ncbi:MAG: P-loop NTPase fold protein [Paludibacter sp.]|nr:P-loop NTPase fold protein [Paludibacter sp.]
MTIPKEKQVKYKLFNKSFYKKTLKHLDFNQIISFYKKYFFYVFLLVCFIFSWFIFTSFWTDLIDLILVDTVVSKFDSNITIWIWSYYSILTILTIYYIIVFSIERKSSKVRKTLVLFVTLIWIICFNSGYWYFESYYSHVLILLPFIFELFVSGNYLNRRLKNISNNDDYNGLEFEMPISGSCNVNEDTYKRSEYIKSTADQLKLTFNNKIAFAIGISGKWGSGKTSFTNILTDEMKHDVDIIFEFKPWFSKTPNDIIEDFFTEYRIKISKYIPDLSQNLRLYTNALTSVEVVQPFFRFSLKNILPTINSSVLYENIKDILCKTELKVLIIIDDLDRLNRFEILEVLRLIRNTANFPYTQFIVTYDKDYVVKTMQLDNSTKADEYLAKIFNMEITLQSFEGRILCDELKKRLNSIIKELKLQIDDKSLNDIIYIKTTNEINEFVLLIPKLLQSKRDVIRFSNSFKLNLLPFSRLNKINEIDIIDFFFLELIRYKFTNLYDILRDNPMLVLYINNNEKKYQLNISNEGLMEPQPSKIILELPKLFNNQNDILLSGFILDQLFSIQKGNNNKSINIIGHYITYFAYRLDTKNLSSDEFVNLLLDSNANSLLQIEKWFEEKHEGQIEDKLIECFLETFPKSKNISSNINYTLLYNFVTVIYNGTKKNKYLNGEIYNAVINHFDQIDKLQIYISKIEAEQLIAFIKFWLYFSNVFNTNQNEKIINRNFLRTILLNINLSNDIVELFSNENEPTALCESIYDFIYEYVSSLQPQNIKISFEISDLVQIQLNQFTNNIKNGIIYKNTLDLYDFTKSASFLLKNNEFKTEIIEKMKNIIVLDPINFMEHNFDFQSNIIGFRIQLSNIYETDTRYLEFEKLIYNPIYDKEKKTSRVRNFWKLYKYNNYNSIEINSNEEDLMIAFKNHFTTEVKELDSLNEIEQKIGKIEIKLKKNEREKNSRISSPKIISNLYYEDIKTEIDKEHLKLEQIGLKIHKKHILSKHLMKMSDRINTLISTS